nr:exopolyphosphatase [uncultured Holophaga sp.]
MRLITRSDFDGLACAALLEEIGLIDGFLFVHPKDVQDGKVAVGPDDVLANVPFAKGCGLWFDHHCSEDQRLAMNEENIRFEGVSRQAPSCARIIYDYYGGAGRFARFDASGLMDAVDRSDSGQLTREEILNPQGWVLLSFIMDPRTGLGRFKDFRIGNHGLMKDMIGYCRTLSMEEILELPDVRERVDRYFEQEAAYEAMLRERGRMEGNVLVLDLRGVEEIPCGNRFVEYALFPEANVSARVLWGRERKNVVLTVGHSILNRTCNSDIGALLLIHGGGGHHQVGTCQLEEPIAGHHIAGIIAALRTMG